MNLRAALIERFTRAFAAAGFDAAEPALRPAGRPEYGDYQANGAMAAAKRAGRKPRDVAEAVVAALEADGVRDVAERVEVAGAGFINVTLAPAFVGEGLAAPSIERTRCPDKIVVDYSSPNLAKEMHVGHLRSTIIGDAMARILETLGHAVIRQNHVGDWGTQFGMLLAHLADLGGAGEGTAPAELRDLEAFYTTARARFDADTQFADRARQMVVALQAGDETAQAHWQRFIDLSLSHCRSIYEKLGVSLTDADLDPESRYNADLPTVVADLGAAVTDSEGAKCVFLDGFEAPLIVQKGDGGYLYATTDLAAVRHRLRQYGANRICYFTDARQALHFKQLFAVVRLAAFAPPTCRLEHRPFGTVMGRDGRPFKTREGGQVKLAELLDEAVQRAARLVQTKNPDLAAVEAAEVARVVGIGAVKYADLMRHRASDYVFDWDAMLSFDGNTAPYLQYAYARIRSLFRRAGVEIEGASSAVPLIATAAEHRLGVALLRFQETLEAAAAEALPHYLCGYLYGLAGAFTRFYETCPVLDAPAPVRDSRLKLCAITGETLQRGLGLLGIETAERM